MRHQYLTGVTLLLLCCRVYSAEEHRHSSSSFPVPEGWELNVLSGIALVPEDRRSWNLTGDQINAMRWKTPLTPGLFGTWNSRQPFQREKFRLPGNDGLVENDFVGKTLSYHGPNGDGFGMRCQSDGRMYLTIGDAEGRRGGAILYWRIHGGILYFSVNEDLSDPMKIQLVKREDQRLTVKYNDEEIVLEYWQQSK